MRPAAIAGLLALSATAFAQYDQASDPFRLVVFSKNPDYYNHTLVPCHEGAATEALCLGPEYDPQNAPVYTFNTSAYNLAHPPANGGGPVGILVYLLGIHDGNESSGLGLSYSDVSNVAVPLFSPGTSDVTYVAFDNSNSLNIQGEVDQGNPPSEDDTHPSYNWYICKTYRGYSYTTLAWVVGNGLPDNPTCTAVTVERFFV